ncbi:MAG TPA: cbb3-type cytochrome c oxidase subunit I, partial [Gammaproteobacteria bacterium]|nr:cbb3-type cytochrome c oxidase subunit I [Gammaproteobacteria bacterium]
MSQQAATASPAEPDREVYNYQVIRQFTVMTLFWGIAGMMAGVFIALELAYPRSMYALTHSLPYFNFSRFRPVHTSIVIFGFGGSALFATSYYVVQRTCQARLFSDGLASFTFWGWQALILASVIGYPLGMTQSREYAEMVWPVDVGIAVVWAAYLMVFIGTVMRRRQPHIYVANWFYLAFILAVLLLHVFNNLQVPVAWDSWQSYSLFSGVQDAMTQWWYGHNVVGFILTAGFLGMMYYFVPKQAGRPVYSYRLSIIHFWALVFLYMWVGGHHLHWTSLPDWVSTLAATFS